MSEENKEQREGKSSESETTLRIEIDNDKRTESLEKQKDELLQKVSVMEWEQSKRKAERLVSPPIAPRSSPPDTAPLN